ncbi:hypothetical protein [Tumebacillus permanentifrigoris]|uniref:Uncharacterized protein n=1 Tax=Tumebacillus permanentifrigoris TaxID=378543 RepID=A0A316D4B6_9BACL|nr:hypothetical protein [Tumebacillus permanentifrigoris]PWK07031.1 hypothetical protein C7459_118105 [Tumebacillus permanentifrigoris]
MDQKLSYDERIRMFNFMAVHSEMYAELGKERVFLLMAILQFGISEGE